MKLTSLNLRAFGCLKGLELSVGERINVIYAPNESGKSTLLAFISAALYGFAKSGLKSRSLEEDYERYRPWVGSEYSGSLRYKLEDGQSYHVARDFSAHLAKIYDEFGSDITADFEADRTRERLFAEAHLGLDKQTFLSTMLIDHASSSILQNRSSVVKCLQSLAAAGPQTEDSSAVEAIEKLHTALRALGERESASGTPLGRAAACVRQLEAELNVVQDKHDRLSEDLARLAELREDLNTLREKLAEQEFLVTTARYSENERILASVQSIDASISKLSDELAAVEPVSDAVMQAITDFEVVSGQPIEIAVERLSAISASTELASAKELVAREKTEANALRKSAGRICEISVVTAIAGVILASLQPIGKAGSYLAFVALMALAVYCFVLSGRKSTAAKTLTESWEARESGISAKDDEAQNASAELRALLSSLGLSSASDVSSLAQRVRKITDCADKLQSFSEQRDLILSGKDYDTLIALQRSLKDRLDKGKAKCPSLENLPETSLEESERVLSILNREISAKEGEISLLEGRSDAILSGCRNIGDIEADIIDAKTALEAVRERKEALQLAAELVSGISRNVHAGYAKALSDLLNPAIKSVIGSYSEVRFDENLGMNVLVNELDAWQSVESLSWGTREQFYVLLKAALAQMLSRSSEPLPMLLDDAFTNSDNERLARISEFLVGFSSQHQVVYFTCHKSQLDSIGAAAEAKGLRLEKSQCGNFTILNAN